MNAGRKISEKIKILEYGEDYNERDDKGFYDIIIFTRDQNPSKIQKKFFFNV